MPTPARRLEVTDAAHEVIQYAAVTASPVDHPFADQIMRVTRRASVSFTRYFVALAWETVVARE